jgi:hypothetical protein
VTRPIPQTAAPTQPDLPPDPRVWVEADDDHPAELVKEHASTLLSNVAVVAVAVGVGWGLWPHVGPWALCAAGLTLAALIGVADWLRRPRPLPEAPGEAQPQPPGPSDPGRLHTRGPGAKP